MSDFLLARQDATRRPTSAYGGPGLTPTRPNKTIRPSHERGRDACRMRQFDLRRGAPPRGTVDLLRPRRAGELVVAIESDTPVEATELDQQFARTPYAVSFETGSRGFTLVTLHVLYGEAPADRVDEPKEIATSLAEWPKREKEWSENLLALGDFNVDRRGEGLRPLVRTRAGGGALPVGDGSGQLGA
jgi:hypothetical protein